MKLLLTACQRGSVNALQPAAKELLRRRHMVTIYATGNDAEAAGFGDLDYQQIHPAPEDYSNLVRGYDLVVVGQSGCNSPDHLFLKAANIHRIPTIMVGSQNNGYVEKLGINPEEFPIVLAVMSDDCLLRLKKEMGDVLGEEAAQRTRVVGWTAFDGYAKMRDGFNEQMRVKFLREMAINPDRRLHVHFTQNVHPQAPYITNKGLSFNEWAQRFNYEMGITRFTFDAAVDLGLEVIVKPHPGEKFHKNYTRELTDTYGSRFTYLEADSCNSQQLILAAYSVTAGRSTCLTEATLLDRNTGGLIPDLGIEWVSSFPPMDVGAIPYTQEWHGIPAVLEQVTSQDEKVVRKLAEDRKKFSVDGNASKRLADIVESFR